MGGDMASFFKKIFGKVEQVGEQAANQAKTQAQNANATASNAGATAQSDIASARGAVSSSAAQVRDQASATAAGVQNQAASAVGQARDQANSAASNAQGQAAAATGGAALFSSVEALFSGGMPNLSEIESAIDRLPKGELSNILTNALHQVPADSRNQIGELVNQQAPASASSGAVSGNPADLGAALAGILKGGGVNELVSLFTGGAGAGGDGNDLLNEVMGETTGQSTLNFSALLKNPLAQQLLGAILPALMKAGGQQR
jgi:hypothetical protein